MSQPARAKLPAPGGFTLGWDPETGRGDVVERLANGDVLRTCFHCRYAGYTGGLVLGSESGSGFGFYPSRPLRGYRALNVWCAQDESIWDHGEQAEYSYGWSENFGTGTDGRRLAYLRGEVVEAGPRRVLLKSQNAGGCYRVTKIAYTRRGARFWIIATRVANRCYHPVLFDLFTGEDPWLGLYRSSEGDVGWSTEGLIRHETALAAGRFTVGGFYDLGNEQSGEQEGSFSNQANFIALDPASPLPDFAAFANSFAHGDSEIDPGRPLDNKSLTALNLGWTRQELAPGEGLTVALALGLAETGEPGELPVPPEPSDEDWSVWRRHLLEGAAGDRRAGLEMVAERVELRLGEQELHVQGTYTVLNRCDSAAATSIRYPVLVDGEHPAPRTIRLDGRALDAEPAGDGRVEVGAPIAIPPRAIRRFRAEYGQKHLLRQATYLVTSARAWPAPISRAVFVIRHPTALGPVSVSLPVSSVHRDGEDTVMVVALRSFRPDRELVLTW